MFFAELVGDVFAVPGDFNLTLLDHLIAEPGLRLMATDAALSILSIGLWVAAMALYQVAPLFAMGREIVALATSDPRFAVVGGLSRRSGRRRRLPRGARRRRWRR